MALAALAAFAFGPAPASARADAAGPAGDSAVQVIVREMPGAGARPERLVARLGGSVGLQLGLIDGFAASVPERAVDRLRASVLVHSVTPDRRVVLAGVDGHDNKRDLGSMYYVAQEMSGAAELWNDGYTGKGVDVALIDSGVRPVEGLATDGKLLHGPDLSFESQWDELEHVDTYGHGTHLAGIIAGRDKAIPRRIQKGDERFAGMAPDARIVSVKVADTFGATDVSQVIAAIDWVVQHRNKDGLNIRVLNLSFGTDGEQDYRVDPLAYAAEVAWRKGIVVVVAAGNGGYGSPKMNNPAYDPFLIAVGGADGQGTYDVKDDTVPSWSSWGDGERNPDIVAPGKSIVSLRAAGSFLDLTNPQARVGRTPRFFRGSGTSQAAAVVSGAAALLIQQRPSITPDELKALIVKAARRLPEADKRGQGAGMLDLKRARDMRTPRSVQRWERSTGTGSLELARGSVHLDDGDAVLEGEQDIFGTPWDGVRWSLAALAEESWNDGFWNGVRWSGVRWSGVRWSGVRWSDHLWSGARWSGARWSGARWSGARWSGARWSGAAWGD